MWTSRALIEGGADVEAADGSIGTPLDNAIRYACRHVARLLVARGAKVDKLWHAAALGMLTRVQDLLGAQATPDRDELSQALWHACSGGQRRAAELLLGRGADLAWVPDYADGTALDAANGLGTRQENVITWLREQGARSVKQSASDQHMSAVRYSPRASRIGQDAQVEIVCADCGCVVDRGVVLVRCGNAECCCRDLPDRESTSIPADRLGS
jgi:hypothetical protein